MQRIDHAVFAWEDLDAVTATFSGVGLAPDDGGTHEDGTTRMATVGFDDGSYLELIAPADAGVTPQLWPTEIEQSAGPCAWCLEADDLRRELKRLIDSGVPVNGPRSNSRERPDGTVVEWDAGVFGTVDTVGMFPFLISDRTPRDYRVRPSESVSGSSLTGVAWVVVAVEDVAEATDRFRQVYRFPTPRRAESEQFGARLASFPGQPLVLAEPFEETNWIGDRLDRFGAGPCAHLIGSSDFPETENEFPLTGVSEWFDRRIGWFDSESLVSRLGVVEERYSSVCTSL